MSKKHRATIKLEPGEAYIVGPIEELEYISFVYRNLAEQAETEEDRDRWLSSADWIDYQVHVTAVLDEAEDEEWS
jgi:hypothetical protein